jgi:hypothetical protein
MIGVFRSRPHFSHGIKLRRQNTDQQLLAISCRLFIPAFIPFDPPRLMQQPYHPPRHPFRVRHAIRRQPFPQIPRFAHVQHSLARPAHQIHSRPLRQCPKKFASEPLHQRLRRLKQPKLTCSHRPISAYVRDKLQCIFPFFPSVMLLLMQTFRGPRKILCVPQRVGNVTLLNSKGAGS